MQKDILIAVEDGIRAVSFLKNKKSLDFVEKAAKMICESFCENKKILIAGNGGSLCDAMHFAEELTGFFREKRKALPAIALSDPGHMSCCANDVGYDFVFSRAVEALGQRGDVFVALTTSGNSQNLYNALEVAKKIGLKTIAFLGKSGGKMKGVSDLELLIEGFKTSDRIQEAHMTAIHIIIEIIEKLLGLTDKTNDMKSLKEIYYQQVKVEGRSQNANFPHFSPSSR